MTTFLLFCSISVDSAGVAIGQSVGVASVAKPGVGQYTITLENESGPNELTSTVSLRSNTPGQISWRPNIAGTELEIFTFDAAGLPADSAFDVVCFRML